MAVKFVDLYYLGGLTKPGKPEPVIASDKVYMIPAEVGGKISHIRESDAHVLIKKGTFNLEDGEYEAWTLDARLAKRIADSGRIGSRVGISSVAQLSNEELLALAEKRGFKLVSEPEGEANEGAKASKKKLTKEEKEELAKQAELAEGLEGLSFTPQPDKEQE